MMTKNSILIREEAKGLALTVTEIAPERDCYEISSKGKSVIFASSFIIRNSIFSPRNIATHKDITYTILEKNRLLIPKTVIIWDTPYPSSIKDLKYPLIIKPSSSAKSSGIIPLVKTPEEAVAKVAECHREYPCVLVQEMAFGNEYRLLVLDGKLLGSLHMQPPAIFGDGSHSIKELIEQNHSKKIRKNLEDPLLIQTLSFQKKTLKDIPSYKERVNLKLHSSLANGGSMENVTALAHPSIVATCSEAARLVGYKLAGVDIICDDIQKPLSEQHLVILEVNGKPDIYIHHTPSKGDPINVTRKILQYIFELP